MSRFNQDYTHNNSSNARKGYSFPEQQADTSYQYNEEGLMYANELFNKPIQRLIAAMAKEAYNREGIAFVRRYPIIKMITFLSKKLFLNGLELVFMQYILEENKWDIQDESIIRGAPSLKDFMNSTDVGDQGQYKCFLLYLTLIAYSAKYYLNDTDRIEMFGRELSNLIPDFGSIFKEWSKRNSAVTSKISPKVLNSIFRKLNNKEERLNYLMMVEEIIHISPPYNNNQNDKKQKIKKEKVEVASSRYTKPLEESQSKMLMPEEHRIGTNLDNDDIELQEEPRFFRQGTSMDGINDMIDKNLHNL